MKSRENLFIHSCPDHRRSACFFWCVTRRFLNSSRPCQSWHEFSHIHFILPFSEILTWILTDWSVQKTRGGGGRQVKNMEISADVNAFTSWRRADSRAEHSEKMKGPTCLRSLKDQSPVSEIPATGYFPWVQSWFPSESRHRLSRACVMKWKSCLHSIRTFWILLQSADDAGDRPTCQKTTVGRRRRRKLK